MISEIPPKPGNNASDITATFYNLRAEASEQAAKHRVASGCAVCSVYETLSKRGWLKRRGEADYRNHLMARHGLEP